ncbi:MAG: hypothetical protein ACTS4Y_00935 [Candidatus Hodgkinia cicadicola]
MNIKGSLRIESGRWSGRRMHLNEVVNNEVKRIQYWRFKAKGKFTSTVKSKLPSLWSLFKIYLKLSLT